MKWYIEASGNDDQAYYFLDQMRTLQQGARPIQQYIQETAMLSTITMEPLLQNALARAFVNGLSSDEDKWLVRMILLSGIYIFKTAKEAIEKLYPSISCISKHQSVVAAVSQCHDPIEKVSQAIDMVSDRLKAMERATAAQSGSYSQYSRSAWVSGEQSRANQETIWQRQRQEE
jgi:prefoldin subunit 5